MALSESIKQEILNIIINCLRNKFISYKPETNSMPFHYRLLGRDRIALLSFMHSLNRSFITSIFEPVAETLAKAKFPYSKKQYDIGNIISEESQRVVQTILDELSTRIRTPDKKKEIEEIRKVCKNGKMHKVKPTKVDLLLKDNSGKVYLFDLKTAKPNISEFKSYKRTLLEWIAIYLYKEEGAKINSYIAIPYNPYEPQPYQRWTLKGLFDLDNEILVGKEFWDFLGGTGAYEDLLNCFEQAGIILRGEIDAYFSKFQNDK
ncbi:MAG: TdeIII family type II restriction endonuclease [Verrucomicrobiia bacterium]